MTLAGPLLLLAVSTIARSLATLDAAVTKATCDEDCGHRGTCRRTPEGASYCHCDEGFAYVIYQGCVTSDATVTDVVAPRSPVPEYGQSNRSSRTWGSPSETKATTQSAAAATTSLYPVRERTCAPGFLCVHGRCALDTIGCQCEEGWSGVFCHELCTKNCTQQGRCMIHVDGTSYCACGWQYQGEFCEEEKTLSDPTTTPAAPTTPYAGITSPTSSFPFLAVKINTTAEWTRLPPQSGATTPDQSLRAVDLRTCLPGFVCVHGRCSDPSTPACHCDPGWGGLLCHTPCRLHCGPYGWCQTVSTPQGVQREVCSCVAGYTGPRCETSTLATHNAPFADVTPSSSVDENDAAHLRLTTDVGNETVPGNHTLSERECVVGLECVHGACKKGGTECLCDPGYTGTHCHLHCPTNCVHGQCAIGNNGLATCNCHPEWTGVNCTERRRDPRLTGEVSEETSIQWYVIGACAVLPLLVVVVAVPCWLWSRGHLLAMKIVHHFRSYEDDDQKKYDAFISYSSADESFVLDHLYPKLLEMNFTVCGHKKDFFPGQTIANNISEAVDSSRRTILIVSPEFLCSEFCRFEYQQAQKKVMRQRPRIVTIMLRKLELDSPGMDPTLRAILHTATSLQWPAHRHGACCPRPTGCSTHRKEVEKFWKRLELSMPKRRHKSGTGLEGCDSCDTALSPSGYSTIPSCSSGYSTASCTSAARPAARCPSSPTMPRFSLASASASSVCCGPSEGPVAASQIHESLSHWRADSSGSRPKPPLASQNACRAHNEGVDSVDIEMDGRGSRRQYQHVSVEIEGKKSDHSYGNVYQNLIYQ